MSALMQPYLFILGKLDTLHFFRITKHVPDADDERSESLLRS